MPGQPAETGSRIMIDETSTPDLVMVRVAAADGRMLRRNVPRDCWSQSGYRSSLLRSLLTMLA